MRWLSSRLRCGRAGDQEHEGSRVGGRGNSRGGINISHIRVSSGHESVLVFCVNRLNDLRHQHLQRLDVVDLGEVRRPADNLLSEYLCQRIQFSHGVRHISRHILTRHHFLCGRGGVAARGVGGYRSSAVVDHGGISHRRIGGVDGKHHKVHLVSNCDIKRFIAGHCLAG